MIKINERSLGHYHDLYAQKNIGTMKKGDLKTCWVQLMSDGRVAVMGNVEVYKDADNPWPKVRYDFFYVVLKNIDEVHATFAEQFTI